MSSNDWERREAIAAGWDDPDGPDLAPADYVEAPARPRPPMSRGEALVRSLPEHGGDPWAIWPADDLATARDVQARAIAAGALEDPGEFVPYTDAAGLQRIVSRITGAGAA